MKNKGELWVLFDAKKHRQTRALTTIEMQKMILSIKMKEIEFYFLWSPGWTEWVGLGEYLNSEQKSFVMTPSFKKFDEKAAKRKIQPTVWNKDKQSIAPATETITSHFLSRATNVSITQELQTQVTRTELMESPDAKGEVAKQALPKDEVFTEVVRSDRDQKIDYGYFYNDFTGDQLDLSKVLKIGKQSKKIQMRNDDERRQTQRHIYKIEVILISKGGKTFRSYSKDISLGGTLLESKVPKDFLNENFDLIVINQTESDSKLKRVYLQGKIVGDVRNPYRLMFIELQPNTQEQLRQMLLSYLKTQNAS